MSRVVAWLASDDAADISGQVFIVIGGDIRVVRGFETVSSLHRDEAWPIDELVAAKATLFGDRPSDVPAGADLA